MTVNETIIDELGQLIFRIETNFDTLNRQKSYNSTAVECQTAVRRDIEKLKYLKTKMQIYLK
jgi:hypothetical protein